MQIKQAIFLPWTKCFVTMPIKGVWISKIKNLTMKRMYPPIRLTILTMIISLKK